MRSFQERLADFEKRGVTVVAISVDPPERSLALSRSQGYTFPLLSDPSSETIRRYDLAHVRGGPGGEDIARPAEFFVDSGGAVRWMTLAPSVLARTTPEQVLAAIDDFERAAAPRG